MLREFPAPFERARNDAKMKSLHGRGISLDVCVRAGAESKAALIAAQAVVRAIQVSDANRST